MLEWLYGLYENLRLNDSDDGSERAVLKAYNIRPIHYSGRIYDNPLVSAGSGYREDSKKSGQPVKQDRS